MYVVSIENENITKYIHKGLNRLGKGEIVSGINTVDSFTFIIYPNNNGFYDIHDFKTLVKVQNTKLNKIEFDGRVLKSKNCMDSSGKIYKEVTCESVLGFLNDSVQNYVELKNWTVSELFTALITAHNLKVEDYKKFTIGEITATDDNDNLYLGVSRGKTWEEIQDCLIDKIGGEIRFRRDNSTLYIDYLDKIGETKATKIEVRHNLKSITLDVDPNDVVTRLIPLGAKIKDENDKETEQRVGIETVNDGLSYIDDTLAISKYGIIEAYQTWDDVTTPTILKTKATNWLAENNHIKQRITADALELAHIGLDYDYINLYNSYPVVNDLIGLNDTLRVIKKTTNILEPQGSKVEFGDTLKSLTQMQFEKDKQLASAVETAKKIGVIAADYVTNAQLQTATANDVSGELEEIRQEIVTATTEIQQTTEEIILGALNEYVSTGDFDTFKNEVSTQLGIVNDELVVKFTDATTLIENLENETKTTFETLESYIRGYMNESGQPVLELGSAQSLIMLTLMNDRIAFLQNGIEIMSITGNTINITDGKFTNSLQIGEFAFIPRENGSLDFKKVT